MEQIYCAKTGEQLALRPVEAGDAARLLAMTSLPEIGRFMRFGVQHTLAEAQALLEEYQRPENRAWFVVDGGGEAVGVAVLKSGEEEGPAGSCGVSLYFVPACCHKGYGFAVMQMMGGLAAREFGARRLTAHIIEDNAPSRALAEKCGFHLVDTLHFDDMKSGLCVFARDIEEGQAC